MLKYQRVSTCAFRVFSLVRETFFTFLQICVTHPENCYLLGPFVLFYFLNIDFSTDPNPCCDLLSETILDIVSGGNFWVVGGVL